MHPIPTILAVTELTTLLAMSADEDARFKDLAARAANGEPAAQVALAIHYRDGKGVAKDNTLAMQWAHRAADQRDAAAMDFVGHAYLRGAIVKRRPEIAFDLYILCNPAVATPGLQLITADDLKNFWRSDHYGALSKGVLSRPALAMDKS